MDQTNDATRIEIPTEKIEFDEDPNKELTQIHAKKDVNINDIKNKVQIVENKPIYDQLNSNEEEVKEILINELEKETDIDTNSYETKVSEVNHEEETMENIKVSMTVMFYILPNSKP